MEDLSADGLGETISRLEQLPSDELVLQCGFDEIDHRTLVLVSAGARELLGCIRMIRETTNHDGLLMLIGQKIVSLEFFERHTRIHFFRGRLDITDRPEVRTLNASLSCWIRDNAL